MKRIGSLGRAWFDLTICVLMLASLNIACMGFKKPWRDYSPRPFSSAEWIAGDAIERGRMSRDLVIKNNRGLGSQADVVKLLGEPDVKKTIDDREVWLYRIDYGIPDAMDAIPISFESGKGSIGFVKDGTVSIAVKEKEL